MSFWDLSDGDAANKDVSKSYDVGGVLPPIPENSSVLAEIKEAKWQKAFEGPQKNISIRWDILAPEQYANRVVFQKLWVTDYDPNAKTEEAAKEKTRKHSHMLATMDANGKGLLLKSNDTPTDDSLALSLIGTKMVITLMVWDMNGNTGNWVRKVSEKSEPLSIGTEAPKPARSGATSADGLDLGDEIPF